MTAKLVKVIIPGDLDEIIMLVEDKTDEEIIAEAAMNGDDFKRGFVEVLLLDADFLLLKLDLMRPYIG